MKKTKTLALLLIAVAVITSGCGTPAHEWYKKQEWTPSSFDYTNYRDRQFGQDQHGFGVSWDLK